MKDVNYVKYAPYLDPNSEGMKLVKNAPESAKKAFAESQEMDAIANGDRMMEVTKLMMKLGDDKKKAPKKK